MKKYLITALATIIFSACSKQKDEIPLEINSTSIVSQPSNAAAYEEFNKSLDNAALVIAAALKNPAVRSFIKTEALKKKTGDYDVIYPWVKTTLINGSTLESILSANISGRLSEINSFEKIISKIPNFQISVPVLCKEWDVNNDIPLVAIRELRSNQEELKPIKAYDSDGKAHLLDARKAPDVSTIAIGVSERVDEKGQLKYSVDPLAEVASRTSGQATILGAVLATDVARIESWTDGQLELVLRLYGSKLGVNLQNPSANLIYKTFFLSKSSVDNVWGPINIDVLDWYKTWPSSINAVYGTELKFYWVEEDPNPLPPVIPINWIQRVTINGSIVASNGAYVPPVAVGSSFEYELQSDAYLGFATVLYTDFTPNHIYTTSTGLLKFKID